GDVGLHIGVFGRGIAPALQPERQGGNDYKRRHGDEQDRPHVPAPVERGGKHARSEQPERCHRHGATSSSSATAWRTAGLLLARIASRSPFFALSCGAGLSAISISLDLTRPRSLRSWPASRCERSASASS